MHYHALGINTRPLTGAQTKAVVKAKLASLMADADNL